MSRRHRDRRESPPLPSREKLLGPPRRRLPTVASDAETQRPRRPHGTGPRDVDVERTPRPEVARVLAELALEASGDYRVRVGDVRAAFEDRLGPDHPAARDIIAARRAVKAARSLLAEYGLGVACNGFVRVFLVVTA